MTNPATDTPAVSVLMNCYNGEQFIGQAIDSVLAQTYGDFELVVWDNRSTDHSREIVNSYRDPRIILIEAPEHTTLAQARKLAFPYLRGHWIGILDVDDLWRTNKLEKQMALAKQHPECGFVYCRTGVLQEGDKPEPDMVFTREMGKLPRGNIYRRLLRGNFIAIASLLIQRRCLAELGGFSGDYPIMEDYYVTLNLARKYPVAAAEEVLCDYRVHGNNASLAGPLDTFEDLSIVRRLFPDRYAMIAALRIITRHFKKCLVHRSTPQLGKMVQALN